MQFPEEVLMMPYIGNGEADTYRTYLKEQVAEFFSITYINAFRMVMGHAFGTTNPAGIRQWCEANGGSLVEVDDSAKKTS